MHWAWNTAYEVLAEAHDIILNEKERYKYLRSNPMGRGNYRSQQQEHCTAGTIAHEYVEKWIKSSEQGRTDFFDDLTLKTIIFEYNVIRDTGLKVQNALQAFKKWIQQNHFQAIGTEVPLLSRNHMYGGTLDCPAVISTGRILFDWKTSSAVYSDYLVQIAAYWMLWDENYPTEPLTGSDLIRFDKVTADFTHHSFSDLTEAKELFLLYRRAYEILKRLDKRV